MRSIHGPSDVEGQSSVTVDTSHLASKSELQTYLANEADITYVDSKVLNLQTQVNNLRDLINTLGVTPTSAGGNPIGTIIISADSAPPFGYLKCNGAAISRTTYADLFTVIGTKFGSGDGSTTFNVPEVRGEFPRFWDDGRGIDAARAIGSTQIDSFKSHTHGTTGLTTNTAGAHTHTVDTGNSGNQVPSYGPGSPIATPATISTYSNGAHSHTVSGTIDATGGSETRPRNIAFAGYISYVLVEASGGGAINPPTAFFTQDKVSGVGPLAVTFVDQSSGSPTSWLWEFSDSTTSTQQNPVKIFNSPGIYTVKLTATNAKGSNTKTSTGLITVTPSSLSVEYLVVGGGAGVMYTSYQAPAGGGGEVLTGNTTINAGSSTLATIGAGGAAGSYSGADGSDGAASSLGSITARGGKSSNQKEGYAGYSGNGNPGGIGNTWAGGGGGGAGVAGGNSSGYKGSSGAGGDGINWNGTWYGGGGGGAGYNGGVGAAGKGGAGIGQSINSTATNPGSANTGGGAGGRAGDAYVAYKGASGGSGIIIVRYAGIPKLTGGTVTQSGGYTYHTFTSSGIISL